MERFDELKQLFESEDGELFKSKSKKLIATADDRLIDSFGEITQFVKGIGHLPDADADDIKEASLGHRLNGIRANKTKSETLADFDELGLLGLDKAPESLDELFADDTGLFSDISGIFNLGALPEDKRVVENFADAAHRQPSMDFTEKYKHLFVEQQQRLASGRRKLTPFVKVEQLHPGNFYVYDGMMCYVVEFGEVERKAGGYSQQRILVIFENGTESKMYRRSLAQRLYEGGTVVVDADFTDINDEQAVGYIYVLQSLNDDPKINTIKDLYKIGVTITSVDERIKNAVNDPTYLMAPVKIVEKYRLTGEYNPQKVEALIHNLFDGAKVVMEIIDKNGYRYTPSEWYSIPLSQINFAVDLINNGEIVDYHYDKNIQRLILKN